MAPKTVRFSVGSRANKDNEDDQQQQMKMGTEIQMLPEAIQAEILTRLTAKSVIQCQSVSKPWLSIIDNLNFARFHFEKSSTCPLLVFYDGSNRKTKIIMHLVEGETVADIYPEHEKPKLTSRMDFCNLVQGVRRRSSFLPLNWNFSSCEGLVCSTRRGGYPFLICNPITKEYVSVGFEYGETIRADEVSVFIGLGFSRVTEKFELLRMSRWKIDDIYTPWGPELRTVGTALWKRVVVESDHGIDFKCEVAQVVYVNGKIYWTTYDQLYICCFDFDRFDFKVVSVPRTVSPSKEIDFLTRNMSLGVLAGSLCLSLITPCNGIVETWVIENSNDGSKACWNKLFDLRTDPKLLNPPFWGCYRMIKHLDSGKVLMHDAGATFVVYDLHTATAMRLCALDYYYVKDLRASLQFEALPHIPSLVSLKDSLGESVKVLKASSVASLR